MADCFIESYNFVRAEIFGKKPTTINKIIGKRSRPHGHTEFKFSPRFGNISFSSTKQDGDNGARFKQIMYSHAKERWDEVRVPMTDEQENRAYNQALVMDGMLYDLFGQLCHASRWKIWKPSKWNLNASGKKRGKSHCTRTVGALLYKGRPDFLEWLLKYKIDLTEIRPDQLDMMGRYYFEVIRKAE